MLTAKQEKFCQAIFTGSNQSDAYRVAYDTQTMLSATVSREATTLIANPIIATRIQELRSLVTAEVVWDQVKFVSAAEVHRQGSMADKQWASANGALKLIGDATGILEAKQTGTEITISKVTIILHPDGLPAGYKLPEQATSIVDTDGNMVDEATT